MSSDFARWVFSDMLSVMFEGVALVMQIMTALILLGTGIVVYWYARETASLRQETAGMHRTSSEQLRLSREQFGLSQEQLRLSWEQFGLSQKQLAQSRRPLASCTVSLHPKRLYDTGVEVVCNSTEPVAVRLKCSFRVEGVLIESVSPEYDGIMYWNLQPRLGKFGHFSWLTLYQKAGVLNASQSSCLERVLTRAPDDESSVVCLPTDLNNTFRSLPELTMDIEVFCENIHGEFVCFPPDQYILNPCEKLAWVAVVCHDKPYWEYDEKPAWVSTAVDSRYQGQGA